MHREHTLTLTHFAYGGEAVGRLEDGRAVFVPHTMPGEKVRVHLVEEKRGFARAELLEVVSPEAARISPSCAHFGDCGGCHYQHMSYHAQLSAKTTILVEQLERIGGLVDPPIQAAVPSTNPFHYRNHIQFRLSPEGKLGYHRTRSQEVLAIQECHLPEAMLNLVWPKLEFEAIPELERIGLRLGYQEELQLILESSVPFPPELSVEDMAISVVHLSQGESLVLAGSPSVTMEVLGRPFRVSARSFFQANTPMTGKLVEHVLATIPHYHPLSTDTILLEAYCGVGLFSAFLAGIVGQLIGIEVLPDAVEDFAFNLDEFDNVSIYEASVERVLPELKLTPQIILVDPPRQGIEKRAMNGLLELEATLLVYVSCDPATLARDARRLIAAGYRLEQITPFDLFPQTYHIESISFWVRSS